MVKTVHHQSQTSLAPQSAQGMPGFMPGLPGGEAEGGELLGRSIRSVDTTSVFKDAMAELTASLSERTQEKRLRERKIGHSDHELKLHREHIRALLEGLSGNPAQQKDAKASQARSEERKGMAIKLLKNPSISHQLVGQYTGGDPTEQYLILRELELMIEAGELDGLEFDLSRKAEAQLALRDAAATVMAEHGSQILADVNTHAALEGLTIDQAQALRGTYRDAVIGGLSLVDTLRKLVEATGSGDASAFLRVHQSMVQALGLDLAAARSSIDKVKLQALASDLFQLATIAATLDRCESMAKSLALRYGLDKPESHVMASELIGLTGDRWTDSARFIRLAERFKLDQPPACAVEFLQASRVVISGMPVQVFQSAESRTSLIDALQAALDAAIDREQGLA